MKQYKNTSQKGDSFRSQGDRAVEKFTDMMIERMESIKASQWKQGWTNGKTAMAGIPQNISGRTYNGSNSFFLQMDAAMKGYQTPVYMTFLQIQKEGAHVLKGQESMPVLYWDLSIKDKYGHRVSREDYRNLPLEKQQEMEVHPFLKSYNVFNIQQTNLEEVNKERYDAIVARFKPQELRDKEGMYENRALDRLFDLSRPEVPRGKDAWVCPIQTDMLVEGAWYNPRKDLVVVPMKVQFNISSDKDGIYKDGQEYYSSALHEMAHSTGAPERLNRTVGDRFGDPKYAKEELVAELTAAMVGNTMGFDRRILNNNAAYLDGWIATLRQEPKFIVSVMADVNKASDMILQAVDRQKLFLGERPLLAGNLTMVNDSLEEARKYDQAAIVKMNNGGYATVATYKGKELETRPVDKSVGVMYFTTKGGSQERQQILSTALHANYGGELSGIMQKRENNHKMSL